MTHTDRKIYASKTLAKAISKFCGCFERIKRKKNISGTNNPSTVKFSVVRLTIRQRIISWYKQVAKALM
jgi:hypothetical protein